MVIGWASMCVRMLTSPPLFAFASINPLIVLASREPGRLSQLVLSVLHELEPQVAYGPAPARPPSSASGGSSALPFRPTRFPYDPSALNSEVHRRCQLLQRYEQQVSSWLHGEGKQRKD